MINNKFGKEVAFLLIIVFLLFSTHTVFARPIEYYSNSENNNYGYRYGYPVHNAYASLSTNPDTDGNHLAGIFNEQTSISLTGDGANGFFFRTPLTGSYANGVIKNITQRPRSTVLNFSFTPNITLTKYASPSNIFGIYYRFYIVNGNANTTLQVYDFISELHMGSNALVNITWNGSTMKINRTDNITMFIEPVGANITHYIVSDNSSKINAIVNLGENSYNFTDTINYTSTGNKYVGFQYEINLTANETFTFYVLHAMGDNTSEATSNLNFMRVNYSSDYDTLVALENSYFFPMDELPDQNLSRWNPYLYATVDTQRIVFSDEREMYFPMIGIYHNSWSRDTYWEILGDIRTGKFERVKKIINTYVKQMDSNYQMPSKILPSGAPSYEGGNIDGQMLMIIATYDYYRASGDRAWLDELWNNLTSTVNYTIINGDTDEDYLIEGSGMVDSISNQAGDHMLENQIVYVKMLRSMAELANLKENATLMNNYNRIADNTTSIINKDISEGGFWNSSGGYYVQWTNSTNTSRPYLSEADNSLVILWDIAPQSRWNVILGNMTLLWGTMGSRSVQINYSDTDMPGIIKNTGWNGGVWPWTNMMQVNARIHADDEERALALLRNVTNYQLGFRGEIYYLAPNEWMDYGDGSVASGRDRFSTYAGYHIYTSQNFAKVYGNGSNNTFNASANIPDTWTEEVISGRTNVTNMHINYSFILDSSGNKKVNITITNGLNASTYYHVFKDGTLFFSNTTDANGSISFTATLGSSHAFEIKEGQVLKVTINQPANDSTMNDSTPLVNASMDVMGTMNYSIDGAANQTACTLCNSFRINLSALSDGRHYLIVYGINGSSVNESTIYFNIDIPPKVSFIPPTLNNASWTASPFIINISHNETNPDKLILSWNGSNNSYSYSGNFTNITKIAPDGNYSYYVYLNDTNSSYNTTETRLVVVDSTAPILDINLSANPAEFASQNVTLNWSAQDLYLNVSYINISFPNSSLMVKFSTNFNLTTGNLSVVGNYTIKVYANDYTNNINITTWNLTVRDTTKPNLLLLTPFNNSGSSDGEISFNYNVTDYDAIRNCSLIVNSVVNTTNLTVTKSILQNFTQNLTPGKYEWSINCTDVSNNTVASETRTLSIIIVGNLNITDLTKVNITNINNLTLENKSHGKINFTELVNLTNVTDLTTIRISHNLIEINSTILPQLNKSATLTLYGLPFANPRILKDSVVCPPNTCRIISHLSGNLTFTVTHFSIYSAEETPTSTTPSLGTTFTDGFQVGKCDYKVNITSPTKIIGYPGEKIVLNLLIRNTGCLLKEAGISLEIPSGWSKSPVQKIKNFRPGEEKNLTFTFSSQNTSKGNYIVKIKVDNLLQTNVSIIITEKTEEAQQEKTKKTPPLVVKIDKIEKKKIQYNQLILPTIFIIIALLIIINFKSVKKQKKNRKK